MAVHKPLSQFPLSISKLKSNRSGIALKKTKTYCKPSKHIVHCILWCWSQYFGNSLPFLVIFWMRPLDVHSLPFIHSFLLKMRGVDVIDMTYFIYIWHVIPEFSYFLPAESAIFLLLPFSFLAVTAWNVVKMVWNFD